MFITFIMEQRQKNTMILSVYLKMYFIIHVLSLFRKKAGTNFYGSFLWEKKVPQTGIQRKYRQAAHLQVLPPMSHFNSCNGLVTSPAKLRREVEDSRFQGNPQNSRL